ncbi:hypothetical protein [uncultured Arthrobacter sp.]|uniref:hypothetical protein n=1 Tax=uncultured Arthrobacter sp. TaxID=114050 RepID=UPI0026022E04|nr:hypothetical protein [uncultured Arthrobacter sp.]
MLDSLSDRGEKWVITAAAFLGVVGGAATTSAVGMLIPEATELWMVSGTITTVAMFLALYVLLTKLRRLTEPIGTVSVMGRRLIMSAMRFEAIDSMANHQRFTATSRIFLAWAQKIGLDTSNSSLRRISLNVDDEFRHPKVAEASIHHVQELLTQLHSGAHAAVIAKARRPETWPAGAIKGRAVSRGFVALAPAVVAVIGLFVR